MLIRDADSVMVQNAVTFRAASHSSDPLFGLDCTVPCVSPGTTLWQRLKFLSSGVCGTRLRRRLALWTGHEQNFLDRVALIRIRRFSGSAGLPHLPCHAARGGVILSGDLIKAAPLGRAGWGLKMLRQVRGNSEDIPATLTGYVRCQSRWFQVDMHEGMAVPGLHPLSRPHLAQSPMTYLASVWRLTKLSIWLLSKAVLSVLLVPMVMVQQVCTVLRTLVGIDRGRMPHSAARPGFATLARFQRVETAIGAGFLTLAAVGDLTPWLLPIGIIVSMTVALSWLIQREMGPVDASPLFARIRP